MKWHLHWHSCKLVTTDMRTPHLRIPKTNGNPSRNTSINSTNVPTMQTTTEWCYTLIYYIHTQLLHIYLCRKRGQNSKNSTCQVKAIKLRNILLAALSSFWYPKVHIICQLQVLYEPLMLKANNVKQSNGALWTSNYNKNIQTKIGLYLWCIYAHNPQKLKIRMY